MEVQYEVELEDLVALQEHCLERDREQRRSLRFNQSMALGLGGLALLLGFLLDSIFLLLVGLLQLPFAFRRFQRFFLLRRYRRQGRKGAFDADLGPVRLVLEESGLRFESESKSSRLAWSGLDAIEEGSRHFFLFEDPTHVWVVPKRGLEPLPGIAGFRRELERSWRPREGGPSGEVLSHADAIGRGAGARRVWLFLLGGAAAALIALVLLVGAASWLLRRTFEGENVPMDVARMFETMNPGIGLGVEEATVEALPDWIPRMDGVEARGFLSKGGGLLTGTAASPAPEVLAFYARELVASGLEIPAAGGYSESDGGGLVQARSPDGCRSVLLSAGEEDGVTQISYQFHDCAEAPESDRAAAGSWARPLPEGPPRAEGGVRFELLSTFTTQEGFIRALDFSADGSLLASASLDGTVGVWEVASEAEVDLLQEPGPPNQALATALALHPEGRLLAYASRGGLFLRDLARRAQLQALGTGADQVSALAFHGDGELLAVATRHPGGVQLFDADPDWRRRWRAAVEGEPEVLALSSSGERLAVAVPCRGFELRDARTGRELRAIRARPLDLRLCGEYFAAAFSSDLTRAANATDGPEIRRWDLERSRFLDEVAHPRGGNNLTGVTALAFDPSGEILAAGTVDGRIELWPWASEALRGELFDVTPSDVAHITFSADGRRMAVGDWHGVVRVLAIEIDY